MPDVRFSLRTFGLESTRDKRAAVVLTPSNRAATGPDGLRVGVVRVPFSEIDPVTGVGVAKAARTTLLRPPTHYNVSIEWNDVAPEGWADISWPLHVPAEGGDMDDLIRAPAPLTAIPVGEDEPFSAELGALWVDKSVRPLMLNRRELVDGLPKWVEVGELVGLTVDQPFVKHGYNANYPRPEVTGSVVWVGYVVPVAFRDIDFLAEPDGVAWSPRRMPALHAWHDPRAINAASGATVDVFPDVSGNGHHLLRSQGEGVFTLDTSGPRPMLRTSGSAVYRTPAFPPLNSAVTVVANIRVTNTSSTGYIIAGSTTASANGFGIYRFGNIWGARRGHIPAPIASTAGGSDAIVGAILVADGTNSRLYVEGSLVASGTLSTEALARWAIGARYEGSSMSQVAGAGSMIGDHAVAAYAMPASEVPEATAWLQARRSI